MKMKTLYEILGISLISLTAPAQENLFRYDSLHSDHLKKLEKYIPITKQEIQSDTSRFNMINSGLKEDIDKIYIIDQEDFPRGSEPGHTHVYEKILCLRKDYNNRIVFHELGHNKHLSLKNINSDLTEKWEKIANFKYGKNNFYYSKDKFKEIAKEIGVPVWKDGTCGPKNGCLHPLASWEIDEDLAFFVECLGYEQPPENVKELYLFFKERKEKILKDTNRLRERASDIDFYQNHLPLYFADTTDHRYKQKLDLLKEYNFFTKEEHEKLSRNLGSLRYLLNEERK